VRIVRTKTALNPNPSIGQNCGARIASSAEFAYAKASPPFGTVNPPVQTEATSIYLGSAASFLARYWQTLSLGVLTLWLYFPTLVHLINQWANDRDFSHGFFVPLFSGYVLWQERDRLAVIPRRPSWIGAMLLLFGLVLLIIGQMGAELFLSRSSLLLLLAGLIVLFAGRNFLRAVLFPWAFLFLMIPIPAIIFNQITFPLQILASKVAAVTLPVFGVPVLRQGNVMVLASMALEVADACSGIRSLLSLVTLAIIYGYLMEKRLWVRYLLAVAAVPVAVIANSFRVITTGLMVQYWDADKAEGTFHKSWGWLVFVSSLLMLFAVHSVIRRIWPDEDVQ
jgi:exosortase